MDYTQEVLNYVKSLYDGEVSTMEVTKQGKKVTGIVFGAKDSDVRAILYPYEYENRNESAEYAASDMIRRFKDEETNHMSQEIKDRKDEITDIIDNWEEYVYMRALPNGNAMPYINVPGSPYFIGVTFEHNYSNAEVEKFCVKNFLDRYIQIYDMMSAIFRVRSEEGGVDNLPETLNIDDMNVVSAFNIPGVTATILKPEVLHYIADKYGYNKMIILPSSIHEVIILNGEKYDEDTEEELGDLVRSVNASCVDPDEVYSDSYYIYDNNENTLITCI